MQTLTISEAQLKAALAQFVATEREHNSALATKEPGVVPVDQVADVGARRLWDLLSASSSGARIDLNH